MRGRARDSEVESERGGEKGAKRKGPVASRDPREKCRRGCQRGERRERGRRERGEEGAGRQVEEARSGRPQEAHKDVIEGNKEGKGRAGREEKEKNQKEAERKEASSSPSLPHPQGTAVRRPPPQLPPSVSL